MATTPSVPLHEIIRKALAGQNPLALGPSYISLSFVSDEAARNYDVDRICTVADIEAARILAHFRRRPPVAIFRTTHRGSSIRPAGEIVSSGERRSTFETKPRGRLSTGSGSKPSAKQTGVAIRAADRTG